MLKLAEVETALRGDSQLAVRDQRFAQGPAGNADLGKGAAELGSIAGLQGRTTTAAAAATDTPGGAGEAHRHRTVRHALPYVGDGVPHGCAAASFVTGSIQRARGRHGRSSGARGVGTRGPCGLQGIITQWFSMTRPPRSRPPQTASLG